LVVVELEQAWIDRALGVDRLFSRKGCRQWLIDRCAMDDTVVFDRDNSVLDHSETRIHRDNPPPKHQAQWRGAFVWRHH
jgi:hypothetical protein